MKSIRTIIAVLFFLLLLGALCGCNAVTESDHVLSYDSGNNLSEYVLENEDLRLTVDGSTSYFSLEDKHTGEIWHSVPEAGSGDPLADATMKRWLQSTLILTYTLDNSLSTIFDNYTNSIANGSFQITQKDSQVRVDYLIGEQVQVYLIPEVATEERFDALLSAMESREQSAIKSIYRKLDKDNLPVTEDLKTLLEQYPMLAESVIYVLRTNSAAYRYKEAEELFARYGYTYEDYEQDRLEQDGEEEVLRFNASIVYSLEGNALNVEIPRDSIRCPDAYQITALQVLPYFGAGSTEDEGFLLIPDGGGAVIDFNSRKGTARSVSSKVYGWDMGKAREQMISENTVAYPVFGIQKNGSYLLAVTESCAGELTLESDVSGNRNSYNSVSPSFEVIHGDLVYVSSKSNVQVMVFEKVRQTDPIRIRYFAGKGDSYVEMAHTYRDYLLERYPTLEREIQNQVPVAVEMIGALDHITQVVGIPMQTVLPATTFREAADVIQQLTDAGIENVYFKYSGVLNGGLLQTSLQKGKLVSELGSASELQALAEAAEANGGGLYLSGYGSRVLDTTMFDGFSSAQDGIRNTLSNIVEATPYNLVTYRRVTSKPYYILNVEACRQAMQTLSSMADRYGLAGVAFADIGSEISSDFNVDSPASRQDMAQAQVAELEAIRSSGQGVLLDGGYDYAVPYADFILNMDLSGSAYDLVSYQVPFYQIALHGLVNYAGEAVNMADDYERNILKAAETGAGLYFLFAEIPASELQMTDYAIYSSAQFSVWRDTAIELYQRFDRELGHTYGQRIVNHQYLNANVTVTVYEDGTQVYVNYGTQSFETAGGTVAGMDFLVVRGSKG